MQCLGLQINWSESLRTPVATKNDACMDGSLTHVWSALSQHSLLRFCPPKRECSPWKGEYRQGTPHSPCSAHVNLIPQAKHTLLIKHVKTVLGKSSHNSASRLTAWQACYQLPAKHKHCLVYTLLVKKFTHCLASRS